MDDFSSCQRTAVILSNTRYLYASYDDIYLIYSIGLCLRVPGPLAGRALHMYLKDRLFSLQKAIVLGRNRSLLNVLYLRNIFPSSAACLIYDAVHCKNMHLILSACFLTCLATFLTL